jgi:hypothetical protein
VNYFAEEFRVKYDNNILTTFINSFNVKNFFKEIEEQPDRHSKLLTAYYYLYLLGYNYKDELTQQKFKTLLQEYSKYFTREISYSFHVSLLSVYFSYEQIYGDSSYRKL